MDTWYHFLGDEHPSISALDHQGFDMFWPIPSFGVETQRPDFGQRTWQATAACFRVCMANVESQPSSATNLPWKLRKATRREARHCAAAEARSFTAVRFIKGRWSLRITLGVKAYWFIKSVIIYNYISLLICKCNFQQWADSITYDHNQSLYIRPQGVKDLVTQKQ